MFVVKLGSDRAPLWQSAAITCALTHLSLLSLALSHLVLGHTFVPALCQHTVKPLKTELIGAEAYLDLLKSILR